MKYLYFLLSSFLTIAFFSNCAGNKNFQERPPVQMGTVYTVTDAASVNLFIPLETILTNTVRLDSVYFRGMVAALEQDKTNSSLLKAHFTTAKTDLIMSSDPREEYANKMPVKPRKTPFDIKDDEAVLLYFQDNMVKYYKVTGIRERKTN